MTSFYSFQPRYFLFWYFDHYTGASAVIHPIVIFTSLFAAVSALRQFSRNGRNAIAIILIMGACGVSLLYLCDFRANAFWLNMTVNGDHLSFPLLRWLQHGGFAQRNVFGTFIASSALLAFHFSIRFWKTNNKIALALLVCSLFLSFTAATIPSLTTLLGLTTGLISLLVCCYWIRGNISSVQTCTLTFLFVTAISSGSQTTLSTTAKIPSAIISDKLSLESSGSECRLSFIETSYEMFMHNPLSGEGLNTFSVTHKLMTETDPNKKEKCDSRASHPHNAIALLLGEVGAIGAVFIILPVTCWFFITTRSNWLISSSILAPIILHTQTELPLNMSMVHWYLAALVPLLLCAPRKKNTLTTRNHAILPTTCAFVGLIFAGSVAFASVNAAIEFWQLKKSADSAQLFNLVMSPFRNHPTFQHKYDRLIGVNALRLAIATNDSKLAETFAPVLERAIAHLATTDHILLLAIIQQQFPHVDLKRDYQVLLE